MSKSKAAAVAADFVFALGARAWRAARAFTRRKTPREELESLARWELHHIVGEGERCVVCHHAGVDAHQLCPGPPATQEAKRKLAALDNER